MPISDFDVVLTMEQYGGSFARRLALAWQYADEINQAKLKGAFTELFAEYAELAELKAKHDARSA